jgi:phosphoribosylpyrophosphate synthetase
VEANELRVFGGSCSEKLTAVICWHLGVAPRRREAIRRIHNRQSISVLFRPDAAQER